MATRFYLPATAESAPISPNPSASWEDTTGYIRAMMRTGGVRGDAMATVSYTDADSTNRDCMLIQYVSEWSLVVGQTVTGSQAVKLQVRGVESNAANNMVVTVGLRIIAADGSTVRKTMLDCVRDATELNASTLTNRAWTGTSAATNYTTVAGDYVVMELGCGGTPTAATHGYSLRLGDAAASDLPEDDTDTTDKRPWLELTDTLTFVAGSSEEAMPATTHLRQTDRDRKYTYGYAY